MIRVGLITNVNERCGVSEYGRNLVEYVTQHTFGGPQELVTFKIIDRPFTEDAILARLQDVDLVHWNFSLGVMENYTESMLESMMKGKKSIITLQDSFDALVQSLANGNIFNKIVVHETNVVHPSVKVIPHGIKIVDLNGTKSQWKIGTAGFPFPWKGFEAIASCAGRMGMGFLAIIPDSDKVSDVEDMKKTVKQLCPQAEFKTGWLSQEDVIRELAGCAVSAFPYGPVGMIGNFLGVSGAVRFGLAATRPVIVSQCSMFRDLRWYQDEVYFVPPISEDPVRLRHCVLSMEAAIKQIWKDTAISKPRLPKKILQDMNWTKTAQMYVDTYQEVMG